MHFISVYTGHSIANTNFLYCICEHEIRVSILIKRQGQLINANRAGHLTAPYVKMLSAVSFCLGN
jgi:hypothetical protein